MNYSDEDFYEIKEQLYLLNVELTNTKKQLAEACRLLKVMLPEHRGLIKPDGSVLNNIEYQIWDFLVN